jgi:hypothetical protein
MSVVASYTTVMNPAVVLGGRIGLGHDDRLGAAAACAELVRVRRVGLDIVLDHCAMQIRSGGFTSEVNP